jgi:hypothetical protein
MTGRMLWAVAKKMDQKEVRDEITGMVDQDQKHKSSSLFTDSVNEMRSLKMIELREKQTITLLPFQFD